VTSGLVSYVRKHYIAGFESDTTAAGIARGQADSLAFCKIKETVDSASAQSGVGAVARSYCA